MRLLQLKRVFPEEESVSGRLSRFKFSSPRLLPRLNPGIALEATHRGSFGEPGDREQDDVLWEHSQILAIPNRAVDVGLFWIIGV